MNQNKLIAAGDALATFAAAVAKESRSPISDTHEAEQLARAWAEARALQGGCAARLIGRAHTVIAGLETVLSLAQARGLDLTDLPDVERAITEALGAARAIERETGAQPLGDRPAARQLREASIPTDICRCHDADCPDNATCHRWLNRDFGAAMSPHSWSLRQPQNPWADHDFRADPWEAGQPDGQPDPGPCPYYLSAPPPARAESAPDTRPDSQSAA